ncbi:hypothetical protein SAMN05216276_100235 [Streptosporangium subroseum]|uniref:Uncharacterized protein n=2 Tax=Streptosporangium subroseum TaxID=106412 RepID=A0A239AMA8_9ACTN|nr:hypothetical protein SAMN05216276_100235 [Streptosporangium subroseum]
MSADVKSGDLGLVGARGRERSEWGGLPEDPASPVFVVERLELAQGMYEVALVLQLDISSDGRAVVSHAGSRLLTDLPPASPNAFTNALRELIAATAW